MNCAAVYCHKTKRKFKDKTFFSSPKDTKIAKLPQVYVWSDQYGNNCFDSSWMLQSTLTYSDRPIQRRLWPGAIPTKFPHKPVKERHFSKQREETHRKKVVCFSYSSETIN